MSDIDMASAIIREKNQKIARLERQIEMMKSCRNCAHEERPIDDCRDCSRFTLYGTTDKKNLDMWLWDKYDEF